VEDIIERVRYPSAPLFKCQRPPISSAEIAALIQNLQDKPTFRGVWTLADDGIPVAILHALDEKNFRAASRSIGGVVAWNWTHHFGRLLSFVLVVTGKHSPRMFVPDDCALVRAVAEHGRIVFAVSHGNQVTPFYLADFAKHPEHSDMLDAFRALLRFKNAENFIFRDDEVAYWLLMYYPEAQWKVDLSILDEIRAKWAYAYENRIRSLIRAFADIRSKKLLDTPYADKEAQTKFPATIPFFDKFLSLIISQSTKPEDAIHFVCSALSDPTKMGDLVHGWVQPYNQDILLDPLKHVVREVVCAALFSPTATRSGLRRPWLDGRTEPGKVAVRYITIDSTALHDDTIDYWVNFDFKEIMDVGFVISGKDIPIPRISLWRQFAELRLDCTAAEAEDAISELLAEARENRQWSVPWGARVQIDIGMLKHLTIYELEGEFLGLFRDYKERFLVVAVNISHGHYSIPTILQANEDETIIEENTQASLALVLIVASVIRDFLVVEERNSQFVTRPAKRHYCASNKELSVIYLPRVRYIKPDVEAFHKVIGGDIQREAHDVAPHLRRVEKASSAQLLLAMRYGFYVPQGYTFVRPHRRGEVAITERQRLFRSRSASAILYHTVAKAPIGSRPAWFDFEKDVAAMLSQLGLRVVHQAASRNGDGGVDIYAHDEVEDLVWAVQCKCYASARKIGPDVVRALAGSLHRYPAGTRGMIVTTSSFTSIALAEAVTLNIKTLDGLQFVALAKSTLPWEVQ
jgi:hypothetical protein